MAALWQTLVRSEAVRSRSSLCLIVEKPPFGQIGLAGHRQWPAITNTECISLILKATMRQLALLVEHCTAISRGALNHYGGPISLAQYPNPNPQIASVLGPGPQNKGGGRYSLNLSPLQTPCLLGGNMTVWLSVFTEAVHWRPNLFKVPHGNAGKFFVSELVRPP